LGLMKRAALLLALLCLILPLAHADFAQFYYDVNDWLSAYADPNTGLTVFPTLLIPLGGRYEGMGTAYTAVALDSGYLEANPSASASLRTSELSFLHHGWIADSNIEGVYYTLRYNDLGLGVAGKFLYVPFTEYNEWGERESSGYISETVATLNLSYNFLSSYNFYGLGVGINLKTAYRNIPAVIYPDQSVLTAMVDVGLLTRFNLLKFFISRSRNFSVGAVVKNLGFPALGEPLPALATFGVAYSPVRPVTWAFDFNLPFSFDPMSYPPEHWYIASGLDVAVTDFLSIQGGVQLKGDNPRVSVGSTIDLEKISFVLNYNLDLSGRLNPLDKFSVEAKLNLGDRGRLALSRQVDELYLTGLEAYARGDLEEALRLWRQALELDPSFAPARDNIEVVSRTLALQTEMEDRLQASGSY
jgi:tetratricopeptide (TPR) repeat protein